MYEVYDDLAANQKTAFATTVSCKGEHHCVRALNETTKQPGLLWNRNGDVEENRGCLTFLNDAFYTVI